MQGQIVFYGPAGKNYQLQTTTNVAGFGSWELWGSASMTNSFRIFPPMPATKPQQFYRAKEL